VKALALGAVLALLWLVFGLPLTVPSTVVMTVVTQPVTVAFVLGVLARPYLARSRRWTR
jgi:hypothetical protein